MNREDFANITIAVGTLIVIGAIWYFSLGPRLQPSPSTVVGTSNNWQTYDTSSWQTYRNNHYEYEIKYPKTVSLSQIDGLTKETCVQLKSGLGGFVLIGIPLFGSNPCVATTGLGLEDRPVTETIVIDGKEHSANGYTERLTSSSSDFEFLGVSVGNLVRIEYGIGPLQRKLSDAEYDQAKSEMKDILSTFKFVSSASNVDVSNWRTYTVARAGLTFRYPKEWGDVVEWYYGLDAKTNEMSPTGKMLEVHFSNDEPNHSYRPSLVFISPDYTQYEGYVYKGEKSVQGIYQQSSEYKTDPVYFDLGGIPAVRFITTNTYEEMGPKLTEVEVYAKLAGNPFGGLSVFRKLFFLDTQPQTEDAARSFISSIKNNTMDKSMQNKIYEFDQFLSTFKFAQSQ